FALAKRRRAARPALFPYTTLFRSDHDDPTAGNDDHDRGSGSAAGDGRTADVLPDDHRGADTGADDHNACSDHDSSHYHHHDATGDRKSTRLNSSHVKSRMPSSA